MVGVNSKLTMILEPILTHGTALMVHPPIYLTVMVTICVYNISTCTPFLQTTGFSRKRHMGMLPKMYGKMVK